MHYKNTFSIYKQITYEIKTNPQVYPQHRALVNLVDKLVRFGINMFTPHDIFV
jgi:hypothetical protein